MYVYIYNNIYIWVCVCSPYHPQLVPACWARGVSLAFCRAAWVPIPSIKGQVMCQGYYPGKTCNQETDIAPHPGKSDQL